MTLLEIVGSVAVWMVGTYVLCLVSAFIGSRFGRDKEMAGLIYVVFPPIIVLILSVVAGLIMLGRISA